MSATLRIYDPSECDVAGIPLDFERCRTCNGGGLSSSPAALELPVIGVDQVCATCDGHGSLKAAALASFTLECSTCRGTKLIGPPAYASPYGQIRMRSCPDCKLPRPLRCEDCAHPMSEGTWEGGWRLELDQEEGKRQALAFALYALRKGDEPYPVLSTAAFIHYSPCDELCDHGGPLRLNGGAADDRYAGSLRYRSGIVTVEASWRQVDVRCLSFPNILLPEKLAILCLRCWAERT